MTASRVSRRDFLKVSAVAGGGLLIGFRLEDASAQAGPFKPNAWVTIAPDGRRHPDLHRNEMGRRHTSLHKLLAEELALPRRVKVCRPRPIGLRNTRWRPRSRREHQCRKVGAAAQACATARLMLVGAAAARWGVPAAECKAANVRVTPGPGAR